MNGLTATPTPRTVGAAPLPAARLALVPVEERGALVERLADERARDVAARAVLVAPGPSGALPAGALTRCSSTASMPSWRAALARIGSMMAFCCMPPGERCEVRGGVLVSTERPRKRIASGW